MRQHHANLLVATATLAPALLYAGQRVRVSEDLQTSAWPSTHWT